MARLIVRTDVIRQLTRENTHSPSTGRADARVKADSRQFPHNGKTQIQRPATATGRTGKTHTLRYRARNGS